MPPGPLRERPDGDSGDRALYGLLIALVLLVGGWVIVSKLSDNSRMEDCMMAGRRNCAPLDTSIDKH